DPNARKSEGLVSLDFPYADRRGADVVDRPAAQVHGQLVGMTHAIGTKQPLATRGAPIIPGGSARFFFLFRRHLRFTAFSQGGRKSPRYVEKAVNRRCRPLHCANDRSPCGPVSPPSANAHAAS